MATTVIFSADDDTEIWCQGSSYAQARAGTGTLFVGSPGGDLGVGQVDSPWKCYQSFLNFDTSWIQLEVPLAVVLSLYAQNFGIPVYAATTTSVPPYTTGSFIPGAALPVAQATLAVMAGAIYNDFTEVSLLGSVNPTGLTSLVLFDPKQQNNIAPSGIEASDFRPAETAGTSQDPKLTVYTPDIPGDDPGPYAVVHPPIAGERSAS